MQIYYLLDFFICLSSAWVMSVDPCGLPRDFLTFFIKGLISSPLSRKEILVKYAISKAGRMTITCHGVQYLIMDIVS